MSTRKTLTIAGLLPVLCLGVTLAARPSLSQTAPAPQTGKVTAAPRGPALDAEAARKQLKDKDVMKTQIDEFLKFHNEARAEVGVPPLVWDDGLAKYAQEWADKLVAEGGNLKHRPDLKVGENIGNYSASSGYRPVHVAKAWYDEIQSYDPNTNSSRDGEAIGHYKQMVWRASTKVGFGVAIDVDGRGLVVANYDPPGNYPGQHPYKP